MYNDFIKYALMLSTFSITKCTSYNTGRYRIFFIFFFYGVTIYTLLPLKTIRLVSGRPSHLPYKMHEVMIYVRSSLPCINIGVRIELPVIMRVLRSSLSKWIGVNAVFEYDGAMLIKLVVYQPH